MKKIGGPGAGAASKWHGSATLAQNQPLTSHIDSKTQAPKVMKNNNRKKLLLIHAIQLFLICNTDEKVSNIWLGR